MARRLLAQAPVRPPSIVIVRVVKNGTLQVSTAESQAVIQTLATDAAHPKFRDSVGSGCVYRGSDLSDSQRRDPSIEYGAETAITVVNQEPGGFRRRSASFYHLLGQPARVRMRGDPRVHNLSSTVVDDEEDEEGAKPQSLNREEIAGPDLEAVLRQELPPAW